MKTTIPWTNGTQADVEKLAEVLSAVVEDHLAWLDAGGEVET